MICCSSESLAGRSQWISRSFHDARDLILGVEDSRSASENRRGADGAVFGFSPANIPKGIDGGGGGAESTIERKRGGGAGVGSRQKGTDLPKRSASTGRFDKVESGKNGAEGVGCSFKGVA